MLRKYELRISFKLLPTGSQMFIKRHICVYDKHVHFHNRIDFFTIGNLNATKQTRKIRSKMFRIFEIICHLDNCWWKIFS